MRGEREREGKRELMNKERENTRKGRRGKKKGALITNKLRRRRDNLVLVVATKVLV